MGRQSTRQVTVGDLTADVVGPGLRDVRWRGMPVINRLYAAWRTPDWSTVEGRILDRRIRREVDALVVDVYVDHGDRAPFSSQSTFRLTSDGVSALLVGEVRKDVQVNRVGWCLLHPLEMCGASLSHSLGGSSTRLIVPTLVAPQPLIGPGLPGPAWGPFDSLEIAGAGVAIKATFEGDLFETEDQRNWTDASFKTYSTPLSHRRPIRLPAGHRIRQEVRLSFGPNDSAPAPTGPSAPNRRTILSVLLDSPVPNADLVRCASLVDSARVRFRAENDLDVAAAAALISCAGHAFEAVEIEVLANEQTQWSAVADLVRSAAPEVVLVLPAEAQSGDTNETTSPALIQEARRSLVGVDVPIGGGTLHDFCELQRHPLDHLDVVSHSWSPTVHAADERSIRETTASYSAIAATARAVAPGTAHSVGPLRGVDCLPPDWVASSLAAWEACGVERICVATVGELTSSGALSPLGAAIAARRRKAPPDTDTKEII